MWIKSKQNKGAGSIIDDFFRLLQLAWLVLCRSRFLPSYFRLFPFQRQLKNRKPWFLFPWMECLGIWSVALLQKRQTSTGLQRTECERGISRPLFPVKRGPHTNRFSPACTLKATESFPISFGIRFIKKRLFLSTTALPSTPNSTTNLSQYGWHYNAQRQTKAGVVCTSGLASAATKKCPASTANRFAS